jgi:hypothetical protein
MTVISTMDMTTSDSTKVKPLRRWVGSGAEGTAPA